jgi:O-methyltransferase
MPASLRIRRKVANFSLRTCGLCKFHNGRLQRFLRTVFDEIDLQHLRDANPCPSFRDRAEMYRYVQNTFLGGEAVDYLEFGVFRGESIREWLTLNQHKASRFFGFDSFEGLPECWRRGQGKGHFDVRGTVPYIDDPRVRFIKGWFQDTVPPFARDFNAKNRLVLHADADLYASTMLPLVYFTPFMSRGTLLIFDEFYDRDHEFKAVMDWQRISKKSFCIVAEMGNYGRICAELI